jgi:putative transposase
LVYLGSYCRSVHQLYDCGMNAPRCTAEDYIQFLASSPIAFSCAEAARVQPVSACAPAHDSFNRLLHRLEPDPETLWEEARPTVVLNRGVLVFDDSTLDKLSAKHIELVTRHWSGKHKDVVRGINLITLLWSDGDRKIPCDYRIFDKGRDGLTKNDHFWEMLLMAKARGFAPRCVLFDSWYASLENLKQVRDFGWIWLTRLKGNRQVTPDDRVKRELDAVAIAAGGTVVHLQGYGMVRVFRIDARDGVAEYWATNDLGMDAGARKHYAELSYAIENYHRDLKQNCGVERCQARSAVAQRNHIGMALRAFLRLEWHFFTTGVSGYETKRSLVREAVRSYLAAPWLTLPKLATA